MRLVHTLPSEMLLSSIQKLYPEVIELEEGISWLAIKHPEGDSIWLEFILIEATTIDDDGVHCDVLWKGEGPVGCLRELRHSYIGDKGYIFYLRAKPFVLAFKHLSKYFDDMEF